MDKHFEQNKKKRMNENDGLYSNNKAMLGIAALSSIPAAYYGIKNIVKKIKEKIKKKGKGKEKGKGKKK